MKRIGHLYEDISSFENCRKAIINASKGKRRRRNVKQIIANLDVYALKLQKILENHEFNPSPYSIREINDGIKLKKRTITKPKFWPDQCTHHAVDQVLSKIIIKSMDYYCTGSVKGRGAARSKKGIRNYIKRHAKKAKYVFKMDVRHYYDSIQHDKLIDILKRKIKDPWVIDICEKIIHSYTAIALKDAIRSGMRSLKTTAKNAKEMVGIPIGIDPSRWFCNLFLERIDHEARRFLGKTCFSTRYVDDIVVIGPNKRKLHKFKLWMDEQLGLLKLKMKQNWQVFKFASRAIDFLGFKFYKDGHITIRKSIMKRIKRKARRIHSLQKINLANASGMVAYMGWIKGSDSQYFFNKHIKPNVSIKRLRRIIGHEGKIQRKAGTVLA